MYIRICMLKTYQCSLFGVHSSSFLTNKRLIITSCGSYLLRNNTIVLYYYTKIIIITMIN